MCACETGFYKDAPGLCQGECHVCACEMGLCKVSGERLERVCKDSLKIPSKMVSFCCCVLLLLSVRACVCNESVDLL